MAAIQPEQMDQQSGGLSLNLSSNNPFRNRAVSPSLQSPVSPFDDPPPRPVSRNPFLDPAADRSLQNLAMSDKTSAAADSKRMTAEDLFDTLTIEDKSSTANQPDRLGPPRLDGARMGSMKRQAAPGRENIPPGSSRVPPLNHRPTRSQEEALRARRPPGNGPGPHDASRSPHRRAERRPRRNSDSSVMDADKLPLTEEEKKEREARRRERERRRREMKDKKPMNRKLDIIDQLDATSIFGTGLFHHDGPFDALNPHRNRHGSRRAPMQAFPKDSLNNVIGGSGPLNTRPDHATFMGNADDEAFKDYATGAKEGPDRSKSELPVFDPTSRGMILHGDETLGLGTSTFLEGTPAARTAIQRREEERAAGIDSGLQRKKSLAQRIRSINRGPREYQSSGRMTNPEGVYARRRSPSDANGQTSYSTSEQNPFFQEYETGKRGEESLSLRKLDSNGEPLSPRRGSGLERRATTDAAMSPDDGQSKQGSGLLARVKSLKGGRRTRPPLPDTAPPAPPGQAA
ncbi:Pal1 cell morphology protein-domain-containing protein [Phialemonium atrogriseum]|uniref:Pal1 cell morphology protein-domain-containing protein n=1 Tax=Phialemonium atrogriseum TaxID=1093897 RepID=A0AAJ0FKG9_9PEZI|nr:Pal1 cell morphology protein-domain-containing protein [Phialemonium atrogriseum]KAK1764070.1 Pal1 cell morphology protein-domain-containing protein [Phialemonium atrogriseum]